MATKSKKTAETETHHSIAEQTEAFLKAGGEIQKIAKGVTGRDNIASSYQKDQKKSST